MATSTYIIRGGVQGYDRLKVLARVMHPTTCALFDRIGVRPGMRCLDVGCGSGDVSFELARRTAPTGRAVGVDLDDVKLELARRSAAQVGLANVEFRCIDVHDLVGNAEFDVVYARFLLSHLRDPAALLRTLRSLLRPGGCIAVEDIDCSGALCHPPSRAHDRYMELYTQTARSRGADPNIGVRLPELLVSAGLSGIDVNVVQHVALTGDPKALPLLTMQTIAEAVVNEKHAAADEIEKIIEDLSTLASDSTTLMGTPRVVQAWATKGARP